MKRQIFHLNRILFLILFTFCLLFIPKAKAIVKPDKYFYVNDYANLLSTEVEEYILNKSVALNKVDGTQIVVVTIRDLEGLTIESYATELFREFGIGEHSKNNGLLLLLALQERKFRIEVGDGLEGILPDGKTGRFQDEYIIPYLKENNFEMGIKNGYDAFYKEIVTLNNLNVEFSNPITIDKTQNENNSIYGVIAIIFLFLSPVVAYIIRLINKRKIFWTLVYFVISTILTVFFVYNSSYASCWLIFVGFIGFVICLYGKFNGNYKSYSGSSYSRSSSSGSSSFRGGGGSSSGGGSTRNF